MELLKGKTKVAWFNPRNGITMEIGKYSNQGVEKFTPPASGSGNDWMLVFEII